MINMQEIRETCYGILAVRRNEGKIEVLLPTHRGDKTLVFPKGHPEPGETEF